MNNSGCVSNNTGSFDASRTSELANIRQQMRDSAEIYNCKVQATGCRANPIDRLTKPQEINDCGQHKNRINSIENDDKFSQFPCQTNGNLVKGHSNQGFGSTTNIDCNPHHGCNHRLALESRSQYAEASPTRFYGRLVCNNDNYNSHHIDGSRPAVDQRNITHVKPSLSANSQQGAACCHLKKSSCVYHCSDDPAYASNTCSHDFCDRSFNPSNHELDAERNQVREITVDSRLPIDPKNLKISSISAISSNNANHINSNQEVGLNQSTKNTLSTNEVERTGDCNSLSDTQSLRLRKQQELQKSATEPLQVASPNSKSNYGSCQLRGISLGNQTALFSCHTYADGLVTRDNIRQQAEGPIVGVRYNAMDWNHVTRRYGKRSTQQDDFADKLQGSCCCNLFVTWLTTIFPILTAFNDYNIPTDLITDLFAGFTVAVMHIPQGMAYGLLAGTEPIYGLYVSLIPVMIISFLGTSNHVSYGTFAIISIMLASSVSNVNQIFESKSRVANYSSLSSQLQAPSIFASSGNHDDSLLDAIVIRDNHQSAIKPIDPSSMVVVENQNQHLKASGAGYASAIHDTNGSILLDSHYKQDSLADVLTDLIIKPEPIEILTVICLLVGIIQIAMAVLRLGMLSLVFSDQLVSSFTTASAVQVATTQLDILFDIDLPPISNGLFKTFRTWYVFAENLISGSNQCTAIMSALSLAFLISVKSLLEPWMKKKSSITNLPSEILLLVVVTLVSHYMRLNEIYGVKILGAIPTGLPTFKPPRTDFIEYVISDSLTIAIVSFALNLSIVQIYAKKFRQKVDANQELFSIGTANLVSSFFWCFPCAASLSRSSVQSNLNVRSPLATLFGSCILVCIICYWAPLLHSLPTSTLACIIVVALKGILSQVTDLINSWKLSKLDGLVWIITFLSVLIAGVTYGLIVGVVSTLFTIFYRLLTPNYSILGCLPGTELYLEASSFAGSVEVPHVKIFRFNSALCYLNRTMFKKAIERSLPEIYHKNISMPCRWTQRRQLPSSELHHDYKGSEGNSSRTKFLIIDCSALSYCDYAGADQLADIIEELAEHKVHVFLAACPMNLVNMFEKMKKDCIIANNIYPSVHDAVNQSRILCNFRSELAIIAPVIEAR